MKYIWKKEKGKASNGLYETYRDIKIFVHIFKTKSVKKTEIISDLNISNKEYKNFIKKWKTMNILKINNDQLNSTPKLKKLLRCIHALHFPEKATIDLKKLNMDLDIDHKEVGHLNIIDNKYSKTLQELKEEEFITMEPSDEIGDMVEVDISLKGLKYFEQIERILRTIESLLLDEG